MSSKTPKILDSCISIWCRDTHSSERVLHCHCSSEATNVSTHAEFVVVQSMHSDSLLVRVGPPTIYTAVNCVSPQSPVDRILSNHSKVFQGVGKLTDYQLVIHTDANVMSVAQTQGRREGRRGDCPGPPGSGGR